MLSHAAVTTCGINFIAMLVRIPPGHTLPLRLRGFALVSLLGLLITASATAPFVAQAHSLLVRSSPAANESLNVAPKQIQLFLNEAVSLQFSSVQLLGSNAQLIPTGTPTHANGDENSLAVPVGAPLVQGTYTVLWRAVSAIDGHLTVGSFAFGVGQKVAASTAPGGAGADLQGTGEAPDAFRWFVRALMLACAAIVLGGAIFTVLIVEPTVSEDAEPPPVLGRVLTWRFARLGVTSSVLLIICQAYDLLAQVSVVASTGLAGALSRHDLALEVISSSRYGFTWTLKGIAALVLFFAFLFIWTGVSRSGAGLWEIAIAAGSLFFLAESLSSHAAAVTDASHGEVLPLPLISDWLHLVMAASWAGGLVYMAAVLFPTLARVRPDPPARRALLARTVPRFSRVAIASVIVLAVTGTYNLLTHSTDAGAILGSLYGQVLAMKIALFVALIALGAVNLLRLSPRLRASTVSPTGRDFTNSSAATDHSVPRLRRNVRLEVALILAVLLFAGGLTLLPPPTGSGSAYLGQTAEGAAATAVSDQTATASAAQEGYTIRVSASASAGRDILLVQVARTGQSSPPLGDILRTLVRVSTQDQDGATVAFTAEPTEPAAPDTASFRAEGSMFPLKGTYLVTVIAERTQANDLKAAFLFESHLDGTDTLSATRYLEAQVVLDPSPPQVGPDRLTVNVVDAQNRPVEGVVVLVTLLQPSANVRQPAGRALAVPGRPGAYSIDVTFDSPGGWILAFSLVAPGDTAVKSQASIDVLPAATAP